MPLIAFGLRRAIVHKLIPKLFKSGMSQSGYMRLMRSKGLSYNRIDMTKDWRTILNIETKKDAIKYVRKDRLPSPRFMADVGWEYDKEYIYKAKTWSRIHPEEPLTERMVTFTSDTPLTPHEVEEQIATKWSAWERYIPEKLERIETVSVYRHVPSPLEVE